MRSIKFDDNRSLRMRWVILGLFGLSTAWFFLLERLIPVPRYWISVPFDGLIPFVPVFVVPYCMWYFYIAVPCVHLFFKRPGEFCRLGAYLTAGMSIACLIYTLFPNGQPLRPEQLGEGPFNAAIRLLYAIDTPTNSAPSLHVIQAMGCHGAIIRLGEHGRHPRLVRAASMLTFLLIALSTVLIKQHSIMDSLTGLMVGAVLYFWIYGRTSPAYRRLWPAAHKI